MSTNPLALPVTTLMRPVTILQAEDSIERAAAHLRENPGKVVFVVRGNDFVGVVSERSIARSLAEDVDRHDAVTRAIEQPPIIESYCTGAEALRTLVDRDLSYLVVADAEGRALGAISPSDLYPRKMHTPRPPMIGGMATPFGVYLTNGAFGSGVGPLALMATGATMMSLFFVASVLVYFIDLAVFKSSYHAHLSDLAEGILQLTFFMLAFRAIPLTGIHAAEHKVVHAIERGEDLTLEVVKRMPRVHPRCGTNIAVGAALFVTVEELVNLGDRAGSVLIAMIVTLFLWRPLGGFVQWLITTKPPTDKQIMSGIKAGNELLEQYRSKRGRVPNIPQRLWHSGLVYVFIGSAACTLLLKLLQIVFKLPEGLI